MPSLSRNRRLEGLKPKGGALNEDGLLYILLFAGGYHAAVVIDIALRQIPGPHIEIGQAHDVGRVRPSARVRESVVDSQEAAVDVLEPNQEGEVVQHGAQVGLAFGQRFLGAHPGAHVANDADHGPHLAAGALMGTRRVSIHTGVWCNS